ILLELITESPERVEPTHDCGGCRLQHMSYDLELEMKHNQVKNVMKKIAHAPDVTVHAPLEMDQPIRYRNKVQMTVDERDGRLITGFYRGLSHDLIDMTEACLAQEELVDGIVEKVRDTALRLKIRAYEERKHRGILRHIVVRVGRRTGEVMVILVTRTKLIPNSAEIVREIREKHPQVVSIMQNVNERKTNVILGDTTRTLWGESYIHEQIDDLTFAISPKSFFQVNTVQTENLYNQA